MFYLASCSCVKNEDSYIDNFIKIHKYLGVEFFLFFDRSDNPLSNRYRGRSDIKVIPFPEPNRHADAWREGIKYLTGKTKWAQFIDIDQVTVPIKTNDIREMLSNYENYASLGLNWHTFGSSGIEYEPEAATYEAYTRRASGLSSINTHIQSIVQPSGILPITWDTPHSPPLKSNNLISYPPQKPKQKKEHVDFSKSEKISHTRSNKLVFDKWGNPVHYLSNSYERPKTMQISNTILHSKLEYHDEKKIIKSSNKIILQNIQVNENKKKFFGPFNKPPTQNIGFIAHYYTRSREYWSNKLAKQRADTGTSYGTMSDFDMYQNFLNEEEELRVKEIWEKCK